MTRLAAAPALMFLLTACSSAVSGVDVPKVTSDSTLQRAFESCVGDNVSEQKRSGAAIDGKLTSSTLDQIFYSCETGVVLNCQSNRESSSCQAVLDMYLRMR